MEVDKNVKADEAGRAEETNTMITEECDEEKREKDRTKEQE